MKVTKAKREHAAEVIQSLRKAIKRPAREAISNMLGISKTSVSTAGGLNQWPQGGYCCPGKDIKIILQWAGEKVE